MNDNEVYTDEALCKRCNRKLTDKISLEKGYGPVCYKKHLKEESDAEFNKNQTKTDESI